MVRIKYSFVMVILLGINNVMAFELTSPQFKQGNKIPQQYTCDGKNISPPLSWKEAPAGTKSFVLIMDDPDAISGTWDHWIVYNIPATTTALQENLRSLPEGASMGKNSWSQLAYGGPCPPDKEHRYFFKLYAVNILLPNNDSLDKAQVMAALKDHVLASTELMTKYQRAK